MRRLDIQGLDPGIRDVVALLRAAGYETTDSGDGVSKPPGPDVLPFPHVMIQTKPFALGWRCRELLKFMRDVGVEPGFQIQGTFDPADNTAIIMVTWPAPAALEHEDW